MTRYHNVVAMILYAGATYYYICPAPLAFADRVASPSWLCPPPPPNPPTQECSSIFHSPLPQTFAIHPNQPYMLEIDPGTGQSVLARGSGMLVTCLLSGWKTCSEACYISAKDKQHFVFLLGTERNTFYLILMIAFIYKL